jgi:hypothetical protein
VPATSSSVLANPKFLVLIACFVLVVIAFNTLHSFSALLAFVLIVIAGCTIVLRGIKFTYKLMGLGAAVLVVLISNGIEGWQEGKSHEKREEQITQQAATEAEQKRSQQLAFAQLSPKQHLDKARALLKVGGIGKEVIDTAQVSKDDGVEALAHLSAINASAPEFAEAQRLRKDYEAAQKRQDEENTRSEAAAAKKQSMDDAAVSSRKAYAQALQRELSGSGIDITIWVSDSQPDELVMNSDLFKDTDNRVYFIQHTLPASRHNLCALGINQVRLIRGGIFSLGDSYSIGCPKARVERVAATAGARQEIADAVNDPDGSGTIHAQVDGTTLVVVSEYYFDDQRRRSYSIQGILDTLTKQQQKLCDAEFSRIQFRGKNLVNTVPVRCR